VLCSSFVTLKWYCVVVTLVLKLNYHGDAFVLIYGSISIVLKLKCFCVEFDFVFIWCTIDAAFLLCGYDIMMLWCWSFVDVILGLRWYDLAVLLEVYLNYIELYWVIFLCVTIVLTVSLYYIGVMIIFCGFKVILCCYYIGVEVGLSWWCIRLDLCFNFYCVEVDMLLYWIWFGVYVNYCRCCIFVTWFWRCDVVTLWCCDVVMLWSWSLVGVMLELRWYYLAVLFEGYLNYIEWYWVLFLCVIIVLAVSLCYVGIQLVFNWY
jgi:hypothetical protein